jgi:hypothetical protein
MTVAAVAWNRSNPTQARRRVRRPLHEPAIK